MTWRCAWCGREYERDDPPCETCGYETYEAVDEATGSTFASEGSVVWACRSCGREHPKHAPPCSRCGDPNLERRRSVHEDLTEDLSVPGYLSVGKPYVAIGAVVVVAVLLVGSGVVSVPGVTGPPEPPDAPGDGQRAGGLDLTVVEREVLEAFAAKRREAGAPDRSVDRGLDAFAEYFLRHEINEQYSPGYEGELPAIESFDPACSRTAQLAYPESSVEAADFDDESALAETIASSMLHGRSYDLTVAAELEYEAIEVYVAPDDTVHVTYVAC